MRQADELKSELKEAKEEFHTLMGTQDELRAELEASQDQVRIWFHYIFLEMEGFYIVQKDQNSRRVLMGSFKLGIKYNWLLGELKLAEYL